MTASRPSLGIIGAGKVGSVLARLLMQFGYTVSAVYSRSSGHARRLASQVNADVAESPDTVIQSARLTLLTVPDDALESLAAHLTMDDLTGKALIHTSGAHDRHKLDSAARRGAMTGSLHPAYPFADVESAIAGLPGATFALESSHDRLKVWLLDIVKALDGHVIEIPPGSKVAYHLALVIASNYTVTLYAAAERILASLGAPTAVADNALNALVSGTLANLSTQGIPAALTGPLVRADLSTLAAHLDMLQGFDNILLDVYKGLARLSYPMLEARDVPTDSIERLFRQGNSDETDHS